MVAASECVPVLLKMSVECRGREVVPAAMTSAQKIEQVVER
jgi:hypothetical protein